MYVLDTSYIVDFIKNKQEAVYVMSELGDNIYTTAITVGELFVGVNRIERGRKQKELKKVKEFVSILKGIHTMNEQTAEKFGEIKANLIRRGKLIGDNDTWIAASCIFNNATLVTLNSKHFSKVKGLKIHKL